MSFSILASIGLQSFANLQSIEHIDFRDNPKLLQPDLTWPPFVLNLYSINQKTLKHMGLSKTDIYYRPFYLMAPFMEHLGTNQKLRRQKGASGFILQFLSTFRF